jgi:hypothetical protein
VLLDRKFKTKATMTRLKEGGTIVFSASMGLRDKSVGTV